MHRRSRRTFLKQATALGLTGVAAPLALNLSAMSEAAAQSASDYKAIVCVFLYGGNDPYNTLIPYDADRFARYAALRTDIGLARDALAGTALRPKTPHASGEYALAPSLAALKPLFDAGQLAVQLNTGPLIQPTTKAQYIAASVPLPPKLFSHNDQQAYWQALAQEGSATGWGGRLSDLFAANNGASTFTAVTAGGSTQLLAGRHVGAYRVTPQGSTRIELLGRDLYGSPECTALLRELTTASRTHLLEHQLAQTVTRSIKADTQLSAALDGVKAPGAFESPLARQLEIVARMIAARDKLSVKRQVFFVSQNGYDNHDGLRTIHPALLQELGDAMAVFQGSLGTLGVADQVTTFTASEFGRTITSNGNGSDHGWGGHHFIMGGAVRGGRFYGEHPELNIEGPGFVDHGRMLPSTSVEQLASTLGAWFGASASDLETVFPNLKGFSDKRLAFI